ncbi:MAG: hypothetical protein HYX42_19940 [Polaromonas sp.]|uniref:hypothetical protein n=1 Tax=Polaromonas sp. TaxID=1869339 RepID=UPI0025E6B1B7|nr:hypothetical protein [Polaromonas sp.]MBI2728515.1 hypothetical protein [Polaromonas sp.]
MSFVSRPGTNVDNDELLLVMASSAELMEAGLDMQLMDAVLLPTSVAGEANVNNDLAPRIMIGRLRTVKAETEDDVKSQLFYLKQALHAIRQMSQEEVAALLQNLWSPIYKQEQEPGPLGASP